MKEFIELRKTLHNCAEVNFTEKETQRTVLEFMNQYNPDTIYKVAKTGLIFEFKLGSGNGRKFMIRADMDALPQSDGSVKHLCGHDGHMAMSASILKNIDELKKEKNGTLFLLFQPAEETGEGALECIKGMQEQNIKPDVIVGLHNLPQQDLGKIYYKKGTFACGSMGLKFNIEGHTSHASHPEESMSPMNEFKKIKKLFKKSRSKRRQSFYLATLTHLQLGVPSFGIAPGSMLFFATLRAETQPRLDELEAKFKNKIKLIYPLPYKVKIEKKEPFPVTGSADELVRILESTDLDKELMDAPMRWSEDFGHYSKIADTLFVGLGTAAAKPLHHPDYTFNDSVIEYASKMYTELCNKYLDLGPKP